jgi:hypothetical protein
MHLRFVIGLALVRQKRRTLTVIDHSNGQYVNSETGRLQPICAQLLLNHAAHTFIKGLVVINNVKSIEYMFVALSR